MCVWEWERKKSFCQFSVKCFFLSSWLDFSPHTSFVFLWGYISVDPTGSAHASQTHMLRIFNTSPKVTAAPCATLSSYVPVSGVESCEPPSVFLLSLKSPTCNVQPAVEFQTYSVMEHSTRLSYRFYLFIECTEIQRTVRGSYWLHRMNFHSS